MDSEKDFVETVVEDDNDLVKNLDSEKNVCDNDDEKRGYIIYSLLQAFDSWSAAVPKQDKANFYDFLLKGLPEIFLEKVFSIRDASDILQLNVETIRRKIRNKTITVVDEDKVNTSSGYQILGSTIVTLAKMNHHEANIVTYCIRNYPREIIASLINLLGNEGEQYSEDRASVMIVDIMKIGITAYYDLDEIPKELIGEGKGENMFSKLYAELKEQEEEEQSKQQENSADTCVTEEDNAYLVKIKELEEKNKTLIRKNVELKIMNNSLKIAKLTSELNALDPKEDYETYYSLLRSINTANDSNLLLNEFLETGEVPCQLGTTPSKGILDIKECMGLFE